MSVGHRLRSALEHAYSACERWITPATRYSQTHYEEHLRASLQPAIRWLDVGCGHQVLPTWREAEERELVAGAEFAVGLDPDRQSLRKHRTIGCRVLGEMSDLPFSDRSFDLVTANMVVEHLSRPELEFKEIGRVLKSGGRFLLHTPNKLAHTTVLVRLVPGPARAALARVLDGRAAADVYPTHYRANSADRLRNLAKAAGLEVEYIRPTTTNAVTAAFLPVAVIELLWIRALETRLLAGLRQTLIVSLRRPG